MKGSGVRTRLTQSHIRRIRIWSYSQATPHWSVNIEVVQAGELGIFSHVSSVKGGEGVEKP